jgi:signal transduction histidine kinase
MNKGKQIPVKVGENSINRPTEKIDYSQLAHDLKGPLNSLKGLLYLALREVDLADAQQYIKLIERYQQLLYYKLDYLMKRLQFAEKQIALDFLNKSQIFDSIRKQLGDLISSDQTDIMEIKNRIPYSEKEDCINRLNDILDSLQKSWSGRNHGDSGHIDLAMLVRDINGSLYSIKALLEIATSETENETARNYFGLIEQTREKLLIRVDETLKRMHGEDSITISYIDFNELIANVKSALEYMDGFADINFSIKVAIHKPFFSDAEAIGSIIQNLVENGIKYRKRDTSRHKLTLSVIEVPEGVMIKINDNGIGIKKELSSRVFNFGVRDKNTSEEGHGIGLSLVKQLVKQLGGEISMKSVNNHGTSFSLKIPNVNHSMLKH